MCVCVCVSLCLTFGVENPSCLRRIGGRHNCAYAAKGRQGPQEYQEAQRSGGSPGRHVVVEARDDGICERWVYGVEGASEEPDDKLEEGIHLPRPHLRPSVELVYLRREKGHTVHINNIRYIIYINR